MKFFLFLLFIFNVNKGYTQSKELIVFIERSITKHINYPYSVTHDSCYYSNTLLKFEIDNRYNVQSISFSDNAEAWLTDGLENILKKNLIDLKKVKSYLKKEKIRTTNILIPYITKSMTFPCKSGINYKVFENNKYLLYKGEPIKGKVLFSIPIENSFFRPSH